MRYHLQRRSATAEGHFDTAGQRKVVWHNMREEPVLYINGKPYVVREANKPFANLEYTGR